MNNTSPNYVQFVRKPVYLATGFLGFLGSDLLNATIGDSQGRTSPWTSTIHLVATSDDLKYSFIFLVVNSFDYPSSKTNITTKIKLNFHYNFNESSSDWKWVHYIVDNEYTNPSAIWEKHGRPSYPSQQLYYEMEKHENPHRHNGPTPAILDGQLWTIKFDMKLPSISLIVLCNKHKFNEQVNAINGRKLIYNCFNCSIF